MDIQYLSDENGKIIAVQIPIKEWEQLKIKNTEMGDFTKELPTTEKNLNKLDFEIGFWHPFGPHGGKYPEEIIKDKKEDIKRNGWTLWSFQFRSNLNLWLEEIEKINPKKVLVFCSDGKGIDPGGERNEENDMDKHIHKMYRPANECDYKEIPDGIKVTLPSKKNREIGTAFIVEKINCPVDYEHIGLEWLLKDGVWQTRSLPTRGEYLIKSSNSQTMRPFKAILELKYPYIAHLKKG